MSYVVKDSEKRITNEYSSNHKGVDIGHRSDKKDNIVYSNCKGEVVETVTGLSNLPGSSGVKSRGNYVLVKHENGKYSRYCHLSEVYCKKGEYVDENTSLGLMGDSGNAYGVHLHFEVQLSYSSNTRIDPTPYLTKKIVENDQNEKPEIKVGDFVIVNGVGSADSYGGGAKTGNFVNRKMKVVKIADLKRSNPYALNKNCNNYGVTGWFRKEDVKKV